MTVREVCKVIDPRHCKDINLSWSGILRPFDAEDEVMMEAYGEFRVSRLLAYCEDDDHTHSTFEIVVETTPVRE